jgi:hypothetical protein
MSFFPPHSVRQYVSKILQYTDNIEICWILNSPRKWNNGMVEHWNIGFQKDISHFNFIANPVGGGTINPTLHYPRTHYSYIPVFHHSNCERSELT